MNAAAQLPPDRMVELPWTAYLKTLYRSREEAQDLDRPSVAFVHSALIKLIESRKLYLAVSLWCHLDAIAEGDLAKLRIPQPPFVGASEAREEASLAQW